MSMIAKRALHATVKKNLSAPALLSCKTPAHVIRATGFMTTRWNSTTQPSSTQAEEKYSTVTKKVVYGLARMMGYYSTGSTAIKASHSLYNVCAEQMELNKEFYVKECNLPDNFQSWFSVTQLHVWMLMVHLRAEGHGKLYIQEVVNRFFEDAEARIRDHGVSENIELYLEGGDIGAYKANLT
ncbi:uncharacterized protein EV154DRAFT_500062 [Mucor mucedo]|uniref:uncharacterized protein n=1 Tax=Mucor mucedo TaxID=29922 RepID=UPI002220EC0C|nr:uncharacterized protein EV154DRAFT_500062 [Mucor mucedo]KAI7894069.1 hypothetical protein EV154DRAFT_500062 [Mucor mucedo]